MSFRFMRFATLVALFHIFTACSSGQLLPASPPGQRLTELIATINSGDYESARNYVEDNFSEQFIAGNVDRIVDSLMRLHDQSQEIKVIEVQSASRNRVIAVVNNRLAEMNQTLGVTVEARSPHRISMYYRGPAFASKKKKGVSSLKENEIVSAMESFLDRMAAQEAFSGVVLIGKGENILLKKVVGVAHRKPDVANVDDTRFNIASVGKLFTAVCIAQLVEQGRLEYQDSIGQHLGPEWVSPELASKVSIEHLLTHRSGFGDFLESETMRQATQRPRSLDDYQPIIREERPQFEPGTQFSYSNSGFVLLGAIVEKVSGQTFLEYLQDNVFDPVGVRHIGTLPDDQRMQSAPTFATGYTSHYSNTGKHWQDNTKLLASHAPSPAGGQYAGVEDLWRFATGLRTGTLVGDSTWRTLSSPAPIDGGPPQGYGFEIFTRGEDRRVGHGGSHEGIGSVLDIYLRSDYTLVVLSNSDRSAFNVREKFMSLNK